MHMLVYALTAYGDNSGWISVLFAKRHTHAHYPTRCRKLCICTTFSVKRAQQRVCSGTVDKPMRSLTFTCIRKSYEHVHYLPWHPICTCMVCARHAFDLLPRLNVPHADDSGHARGQFEIRHVGNGRTGSRLYRDGLSPLAWLGGAVLDRIPPGVPEPRRSGQTQRRYVANCIPGKRQERPSAQGSNATCRATSRAVCGFRNCSAV